MLITGEGEEEEGVLWFSCQDMAVFMRRWLMRKANMKVRLEELQYVLEISTD